MKCASATRGRAAAAAAPGSCGQHAGGTKALVLCSDMWHPAWLARDGLEALPDSGFVFDWMESAGDWVPGLMAAYPVVILAKSNNVSAANETGWMTDDVQAAFADYVRKGNGLLAIHSGTAGYDKAPVLRGLLGGVFSHHPEQCPVTVEPRIGHSLCAGSYPFTLEDEQYFITLDDMQADVFVTTRSKHGEEPGGWRRTEGAGRVAVLTPGHNVEVWQHLSFQALLRNALRWCGKLA